MNTNKIAVTTEFGAETRFELQPTPDAFTRLKDKLVALRLSQAGTKWETALRDAANDAAALAWTTTVPALVFPVLFEEKVAAAISKDKRQTSIWRKSRDLVAA
jgi:hypothetical protein